MTRRASAAIWLAVAVPAAILAAGWARAALGERDARVAETAARARAVATTIAAAVDESLEELRAREDAWPAGAFSPIYVPEDVITTTGAVALSPLRRGPTDPRLRGHAQVQPGGAVETPYDADGAGELAEADRAAEVRARLAADDLAPVRALAYARPGPGDIINDTFRRARETPAPAGRAVARGAPRPAEAPVTQAVVQMNAVSGALFTEVAQARAGDRLAQRRQLARAQLPPPRYARALRTWSEQLAEQSAITGFSPIILPALSPFDPNPGRPGDPNPGRAEPNPGPAQDANPGGLARPATAAGSAPGSVDDIDVDTIWYTPFRWVAAGEEVALVRVVSHGGASTVQVGLADRAELEGRWLPNVVARYAGDSGVTLRSPEAAAACALEAPVSRNLARPVLCFPETSAGGADGRLALEGALVLGLALALLVAAGLIVRASGRAAALARDRADFVSAVSHELRTPLTTIRMNAELLRDDLVPPDRRARTAGAIATESVRLGRLVENVLETTRLEQGRRPLRRTALDLTAAVRDLLRAHEELCAQRGVALELRAPATSVPAEVDPEALASIVANLVENAVKYGACGTGGERDDGGHLDARHVRVTVEPAGPAAADGPALIVEDRGPRRTPGRARPDLREILPGRPPRGRARRRHGPRPRARARARARPWRRGHRLARRGRPRAARARDVRRRRAPLTAARVQRQSSATSGVRRCG